jgi:hypothetical protein
VARLGRRYVTPIVVRNPMLPGIVYNDSGSGDIPLSGTGAESLAHSGSGSGVISISGTGVETHLHFSSCGFYGSGTYGDCTYGEGVIGTIPISGFGAEEYVPPPVVSDFVHRPRVGYGV